MTSLQILNCEIGTISSRQDGSVKASFVTPELRPSEKGAIMDYHGKACCVTITPLENAGEIIKIVTERGQKTPSQRMHAILFLCWKAAGEESDFESYYRRRMEQLCERLKAELPA